MPRVFISYRRDDTQSFTGRLRARLAARFGRGNVFRDLDSLGGGDEFREVIRDQLGKCDICLVIIGERWLIPRLQDPGDLARIEIETALTLGVRVIPVLTGKAAMPARAHLPETLWPLLDRHAVEVREAQFDRDAKALMNQVGAGRRPWIIAVACLVGVAILGVWWATRDGGHQAGPTGKPVSVEQSTTGSQSPAVQGVEGDVTISFGPGEQPEAQQPESRNPEAK